MSTILPLLSSPSSFFPLAAAFVDGFEHAVLVYTSNPRFIVSALAMILFITYYLSQVARKPDVIGKESKFKWFIRDNCTVLNEKFWPTCWAFGTHVQTALANAIRNTLPDLQYERQYINCPDGGQVSLDWYIGSLGCERKSYASNAESAFKHHHSSSESNEKPSEYSNRPIAVFIPGLTGDSQTEYIKSLIPHAQACGYTAVAFNNRGRGGMKLKTSKLYNAVDHSDLALALETIRARYPKSTIIATGISLGGILLCRYLIERRHQAVPDAAVLLSVCFDLQEGAKSMESQGLNLALNRHLAKSLVSLVVEQQDIIKTIPGINYEEILKSNTLRDFDERFTVKAFGFESSEHYYIAASNFKRIGDICVPTLCINAADDMFAPLHSLPTEAISQNPCTVMVITHRGGHIGFMEGLLPFLPFYSERLLKQFYQAVLSVKNIRKQLSSV